MTARPIYGGTDIKGRRPGMGRITASRGGLSPASFTPFSPSRAMIGWLETESIIVFTIKQNNNSTDCVKTQSVEQASVFFFSKRKSDEEVLKNLCFIFWPAGAA